MSAYNLYQPLVRNVQLPAPPAAVWEALTQPQKLRLWSFDIPDFTPERGVDFTFWGEKDGIRFLHICKVVAIEKEKMMKWLWTYEGVPGDTFVTFELLPQGTETLFRLTHEGLENLPQNEYFAKSNFEEGWTALVQNLLPNYLASQK